AGRPASKHTRPDSLPLPTISCHPNSHPRPLHSFPTRRSSDLHLSAHGAEGGPFSMPPTPRWIRFFEPRADTIAPRVVEARQRRRSEEHTSELQSRGHLVCRLLLEKKKDPPPPPPLARLRSRPA